MPFHLDQLKFWFLIIATFAIVNQILFLSAETIQCRGYIPEEVAYPTPYISAENRGARCKVLFSKYNSTGTANLVFVGQNTYHNPCKIECGLCVENELPSENEDANIIRSYPPHMSLKDSIVKCPDEVEVFEQFMQNGIRCGPFHVCQDNCCVAKPEMFPNSKKLKQKLQQSNSSNNFSQEISPEWTKPLTCNEEGYFRNPNDCHKFYRCHKSGARFSKTLFDCNPSTLVFDEQFRVCVSVEENGNVCDLVNPSELIADY